MAVALRQPGSVHRPGLAGRRQLRDGKPDGRAPGSRGAGVNQFGPRLVEDGVLFRLWAPDAKDIVLQLRDSGEFPLQPAAEGWWEARLPCGPGTRYRFRLGDTIFPDP